MKKTLRFVLMIILITVSSIPMRADGGDGVDIPIIKPGGSGGSGNNGPHAPEVIPIQASYENGTGTIDIVFLQNIGYVSVNVTNVTENQTIISTTVAGFGAYYFPILGTEGFYTITFTLSNGVQYYGEFTL